MNLFNTLGEALNPHPHIKLKFRKYDSDYQKLEEINDRIIELDKRIEECAWEYYHGHLEFLKPRMMAQGRAYKRAIRRYKDIHNALLINLML